VNDDTNPNDLKCVCKEGYHTDLTTGMCKSCEDDTWGCDTCTYGGNPLVQTCSSCKYSYLMLNKLTAENKCVHKLNNC